MRIVRRMDGIQEEVTKPVEVTKLVEPQFVTLVKSPANQVAFKTIRNDNGDNTMSKENTTIEPTRRRRVRSSTNTSLLFIEFPEGATDDDVKAVAEEFGLTGYEVFETSDGRKGIKRNDLTEIPANAVTVTVDGGKRIGVARSSTTVAAPAASSMPFLEVAAIEFDKEVFPDEVSTGEYLQRYDIDFLENGVENTDKLICVTRSELSEDAEVRKVQVETGVVAVVTRAATEEGALTSSKFTEVVSDTAYGQWGWGQLDFAARLADKEFCNAAESAIWVLYDLVYQILFWNELPVAVRKELVSRATTQFSEYIGALIDGLPSKVILVNRSSLEKKESNTMNKTAATTAPAETKEATTEQSITRSEIQTMITEAVTSAVTTALAARNEADPAKGEGQPAAGTETKEGEGKEGAGDTEVAQIVRSTGSLIEAVTKLTERMDKVEGATTVRSDVTDPATEQKGTKRTDVFSGMFGSRKAE